MSTSKKDKKSGFFKFGLVELLVVLFIIGLGVSMLMPAVMGAQDSAMSAVHASNMRQHAQLRALYGTPVASNYDSHGENSFRDLSIPGNDFSTFSIDVDTASYSDMRSQLRHHNMMPYPQGIRIEEMINYFDYQYTPPTDDSTEPFRYHTDSSVCPWNERHLLLRIGIQGKEIQPAERPACNLVFLIDTSGSMQSANKIELLKRSFRLLVEQLDERDTVSIVTYAGSSGVALAPCSGDKKNRILTALARMEAGGGTNGASGIRLAYDLAQRNYKEHGSNRIILATDGDFNVGITDRTALLNLIKTQAKSNVFLSIHGYGMDNRQDGMLEDISNNGNGTYAFIDTIHEAKKVMVEDLTGSLICIAKDVKIQCAWNPLKVAAWRLIGYENRVLETRDFKDDRKDAGDIGAGHNVTALYEIVPFGVPLPMAGDIDANPFIQSTQQEISVPVNAENTSSAWLQLRLRYKEPEGNHSTEIKKDLVLTAIPFEHMDTHFRWSAAVAGFGMLLKNSIHKGSSDWPMIIAIAKNSRGQDRHGYRAECIQLMESAELMQITQ